MNQIEASFLKSLGVYGNKDQTDALIQEFKLGYKGSVSPPHRQTVAKVKNLSSENGWYSFSYESSQKCSDLMISLSFRGKTLTWQDIGETSEVGPWDYPTDFGECCLLMPHVGFDPYNPEQNLHDLNADALNGETNGLDIILDAEQFNYAYHHSNAAGFKISLHSHLEKPILQFSSELINLGTETQINVKPTITYTTDYTIDALKPEDRECYQNLETNLTYLKYEVF